MGKQDDFDLIDEQAVERESRSLLWFAVIAAVIAFGLAMVFAVLTLSSRLNGTPVGENPQSQSSTLGFTTPTSLPSLVAPTTVATATVAPAPTPSAIPTATPAPTATAIPSCTFEVDREFAPSSGSIDLGCPLSAPGQIIWAAWEPFEHGALLWRSDTDRAYAFLDRGLWTTIDERWSGEPLPSRGEPPPGLTVPTRGFGYIWGTNDSLFNALGWAIDAEKGFCARVQNYARGFVIQSEPVPSCSTDELFNHAASTNWQPFLIIADQDQRWRN